MRPHELASITNASKGRTEQRYLSPSISVATKRELETSLERAFLFEFSLNTEYWQYESTSPSTWWDHDTQSYMREGNKSFTAFHFFRSDWHDISPSMNFVVAFGMTENGLPWAKIDAGSLYEAAVSGQMGLVKEQIEKHVRANKNSSMSIQRWSPSPWGASSSENQTGSQTVSTTRLDLSIVSTVVNGHCTFIINMRAQPKAPVREKVMLAILIIFLPAILVSYIFSIEIFSVESLMGYRHIQYSSEEFS
ncbi:uncharacterized protein B0J16DRAFT_333780 [Fusarium flagelliforme]|uniref:uncharacterized protein n=1 Tax=Fusarium flagelliforme TaxID=2675880 RepID=UPI001E8E8EEF|nr:uncharacterized protein B0J16DRAFT_333780 [Fusarium flagelliforme]KAH7192816.1 hypothetical protein B0J16DRAFT_333780 [Fusarium flagelliforme]